MSAVAVFVLGSTLWLPLSGRAQGPDKPNRFFDKTNIVSNPNEIVEPTEAVLLSYPVGKVSATALDPEKGFSPTSTSKNEDLGNEVLLYESFEGVFPGSWIIIDNNGATGGDIYWDDTSFRSFLGNWSAWCADGGVNSVPAGGQYLNNMDTWMIYGPLDFSDAEAGSVSLRHWNDSEQDFDFFKYLVSIDGSNFFGYQVSGNSGGWQSRAIDLTSVPGLGDITGTPSIWIAFRFESDGSLTGEGAYVDEVRVTKSVSPAADLDLELLDGPAGTFSPGDLLDLHNVTRNIGGQSSSSYRITFYASTNTTISSADAELGFVDRGGLSAGGVHNFVTTGPLPEDLPTGSYYLGAILSITDADPSNNIAFDPIPIQVTTPSCTLSASSSPVQGGATSGSGTYPCGTTVTVTADSSAGYAFDRWSENGAFVSSSATYSFVLSSDRSLVAEFSPSNQHQLSILKEGPGAGVVISKPSGIDCGAVCAASFASGATVALIPKAFPGSTFTGWTGAADCLNGIVTLNASLTCTAHFSQSAEIFEDGFKSGDLSQWSSTSGVARAVFTH